MPGPTETTALPVEWWTEFVTATPERRERILRDVVPQRLPGLKHKWLVGEIIYPALRETNPVASLRTFEEQLEAYGQRNQLVLLPAERGFDLYLASDEAASEAQRHEDLLPAQALVGWLESRRPATGEDQRYFLEVRWSVRPFEEGLGALVFQVVSTSPRNPRRPCTAETVLRYAYEARRQESRFPAESQQMLLWLASDGMMDRAPEAGDDGTPEFYVEDAMRWILRWSGSGLLRWGDGDAVQPHPEPARLALKPSREGGVAWCVHIPGEGGAPDEDLLPAEAGLVAEVPPGRQFGGEEARIFVRRGARLYRLETGRMPWEVLLLQLRASHLPASLLRDSAAAPLLVGLYVEPLPPARREGLIQFVAGSPAVDIRLHANSHFSLSARLTGHGERFDLAGLGMWRPADVVREGNGAADEELQGISGDEAAARADDTPGHDTPTEAAPGALMHLPARESVEPVEQWLADLTRGMRVRVVEGELCPVLEWEADRTALLRAYRLWPQRPRGVQFRGNRVFAQFVQRRAPGRVRAEVTRSGIDWLDVDVRFESEMEGLTLQDVLAALRESDDELVLLPGGRAVAREDLAGLEKSLEQLASAGVRLAEGTQRVHALQVDGAGMVPLTASDGTDASIAAFAAQARELAAAFAGLPDAAVAPAPAAWLRPYQRDGVNFIVWACETFGGGLLADDMGLGKTLQVLAALTALRTRAEDAPPALVVCPASVAHNWQREAERFAPGLRVAVVESGPARREILQHPEHYDLVVTNYALLRRDVKALRAREWLLVVADEAQAIKNPESDTAKAIKSLNARYRVALTGTPVENRLTDLWSIVDFVVPGYLGAAKDFAEAGVSGPADLRALRGRLRPVLLRRMKEQVAPELPERIEERIECELTPEQRRLYAAELKKSRLLLRGAGEELGGPRRIEILAAITRLRQLCCDPALAGHPDAGSGKVDELLRLLQSLLLAGHKVLVFSQFVRMLQRLKDALARERIPTHMLTGQTRNRRELVDGFESDPRPSVFLLSLRAAGTGLNLVSASHVVLFDPWWNPAVEAQAIDRTHRIGQDKTVIAFRLVAAGTIEERIVELQERKKGLVEGLFEEESFSRSLSAADFAYLMRP